MSSEALSVAGVLVGFAILSLLARRIVGADWPRPTPMFVIRAHERWSDRFGVEHVATRDLTRAARINEMYDYRLADSAITAEPTTPSTTDAPNA